MTDWKAEHDAELMLRREWSARAQKAEGQLATLHAALPDGAAVGHMTDRLIEAAVYYEGADTFYAPAARRELSEAREAIEKVLRAVQGKESASDQN
jgi:hypothetical protein